MACTSLTALPRACADGIGGLEKVYMVAFKDLAVISGTASNGNVYTTAANGIVNAIGATAGEYVGIGLLKSTSGISDTLTKDTSKGTSFFTQTFTVTLADLTIENILFIKAVVNQPVSVIVKTRTGRYFVAGLNGQFELSGLEGGTGTVEGDLNGYTLTFSGISTTSLSMLDSSIISTLVA